MVTQLRRYALRDGVYDEFIAWWRDQMRPAREAFGYTVDFGYGIRETNEFVWSVTVEGDVAEFARFDESWMASDARSEVFGGRPPWTSEMTLSFVEVVG